MKIVNVEITIKVQDDCDISSWLPLSIEESLYGSSGEELIAFKAKESACA